MGIPIYGNMPTGCWEIVGNGKLAPTHFENPNAIFSTGTSWGRAHETYGEIGNNNIYDLTAPDGMADLHRRSIAMTLDGINARNAAMHSAYSNNYFEYNTGVDPSIFDVG